MKNLVIVILTVMTTTLGYPQDLAIQSDDEIEMHEISSTAIPTVDIIKEIQHKNTPAHVKHFENLAFQWKQKNWSKYNNPTKPFHVALKSHKGQIKATYNVNGALIAIHEEFKNVALPKHLIVSIYKKHEGWKIIGNTYAIAYKKNNLFKMRYEVALERNNQIKHIQIGTGDML